MKREILFRGKRTDNGEWVEGFWAVLPTDEGEPEYTVIEPIDDEICLWHRPPVYPETVGQYTGLTDAKGEKIFEGDVIRNKNNKGNTDFVVEWYDGGFVYRDTKVRAFGNDLTQSDADNMEIVGNIHDDEECWRLNHEY